MRTVSRLFRLFTRNLVEALRDCFEQFWNAFAGHARDRGTCVPTLPSSCGSTYSNSDRVSERSAFVDDDEHRFRSKLRRICLKLALDEFEIFHRIAAFKSSGTIDDMQQHSGAFDVTQKFVTKPNALTPRPRSSPEYQP